MPAIVEAQREVVDHGLRSTQEFLASLNATPASDGYSRTGAVTASALKPTIFDSDA